MAESYASRRDSSKDAPSTWVQRSRECSCPQALSDRAPIYGREVENGLRIVTKKPFWLLITNVFDAVLSSSEDGGTEEFASNLRFKLLP